MVRPVSPSPSAASEKNEMDLAVSTVLLQQPPDYLAIHYLVATAVVQEQLGRRRQATSLHGKSWAYPAGEVFIRSVSAY